MFVGLAMFASLAYAQTETASRVAKASIQHALKTAGQVADAPVDYKASIFTKDEGADTIHCFTFAPSDTVGIRYGMSSVLTATDVINDTAVAGSAHTVPLAEDVWYWISDSASFCSTYSTQYPNTGLLQLIQQRMFPAANPGKADDGFMFLTYREQSGRVGNFNTYFSLPPVVNANPSGNNHLMVEVRLTQTYAKYYDRCFIDYKIGNSWKAREINVEGIDVEVNTLAAYHPMFTMPAELMTQDSIYLRFRGTSNRRGNIYGYLWAVDNVAVMSVTRADRWNLAGARALDGFYGTIPHRMEIPLTYGISAYNVGTATLTDAKLTVSAGTTPTNFTTVATGTGITMPAGNVSTPYNLIINERGFYVADSAVDYYGHGWYGEFENYGNTTGTLIGGYQGRALPTNTLGKNYYTITATASNNSGNGLTLNTKFDTVLYTVSDFLEQPQSGRIEGYRWGVDNGIIPAGSIFCPQFTDDGFVSGDTADNHYTNAGYYILMRYVTGNTVPNDFRFRGLEIVPQTMYDTARMRGATIMPFIFEEIYFDDGTRDFASVPCGIDNRIFSVDGSQANQLQTGYIRPETDYNAINIPFPDQPALKPNTSYYFGYVLNSDAYFAPAGQESSYRTTNDTGAFIYTRYSNDPEIADYYAQNMMPPTPYHVFAYDPMAPNEDRKVVYGSNIDNHPLIRPIVGERMEMPESQVIINCDALGNTDTNGFYVYRGGDSICNNSFNITVGSSQAIEFYPSGDHSFIDTIYLNNVPLTVYNEETGDGDLAEYEYNVVDNPNAANPFVYLQRSRYVYYISEVQENMTYVFTAKTHWEEHLIGIDPVASEVSLGLAPNPATSTVKLNISGVSGMVNCNIIDMSGRVIYNANINAEGENTINVSSLPAGAYFVRITNSTFSKIEKLIIR